VVERNGCSPVTTATYCKLCQKDELIGFIVVLGYSAAEAKENGTGSCNSSSGVTRG